MTQEDLLKVASKYIDAIVEDERKELIDKACTFLYTKLADGKVLNSRLIDDMREYLEL